MVAEGELLAWVVRPSYYRIEHWYMLHLPGAGTDPYAVTPDPGSTSDLSTYLSTSG